MSRGPQTSKQRDLVRAVKAVAAAGMSVAKVEVDKDGKIIVVVGKPDKDDPGVRAGMGRHLLRRLPKFVHGFLDRHGRPRFYLRRPAFKPVPLPGLPWSPEFMAAYEQAMASQPPAEIGGGRTSPERPPNVPRHRIRQALHGCRALGTGRDRCNTAELPHCTFHGLRKAAASRLAEAGATVHEIAAITGHATLKEIERYTKTADRKRLAAKAIAKMKREHPVANLADRFANSGEQQNRIKG
jgi:integrase